MEPYHNLQKMILIFDKMEELSLWLYQYIISLYMLQMHYLLDSIYINNRYSIQHLLMYYLHDLKYMFY